MSSVYSVNFEFVVAQFII